MTNSKPVTNKELRSFGLLVGAVFALIAIYPLFKGEDVRIWSAVLSAALIGPAIVFPPLLRLPFRAWNLIGTTLGWVNTRMILTLIYVVAIVPVSIILRITGKDPLKCDFAADQKSYRETREKSEESSLKNQY
jgi:hypothetical protein